MPESAHAFFTRYIHAIAELDYDVLETMVHPEFVGDYPQSGERMRGFAAMRAQLENYPGGLRSGEMPVAQAKIVGGEERWVITPGYTVLPLAGPERYTTVARAHYPDGSRWWVVSIVALRDNMIYRSETYFAPDFDPPEWRRPYVELFPREDQPR